MKKVLLFAVMLAIAASCSVSEIDSVEGSIAPEITASYENNGRKTTITTDEEGIGTIWWKPADEINVFYGTLSTHYISKNTENATTVVFGTTDIIGSTESASENIWGLYPYNEDAVCDGESVTTTIPAIQKAVAGTFDDDIFTSLAHSENTTMKFYNVLGGIKFSISRDDIQTITFKGNNDEDIAGKVKLEMNSDGRPEATVVEGEKTITLTPKVGTTFAKNTNYYIVMLPNVLSNGFTMTFETEDELGTFVYTEKSVAIKRTVFSKKENIDSYASFEKKDYKTIPFTISSIGSTSVALMKEGTPYDIALEYRKGTESWREYTIGSTINLANGEFVQFRAGEVGNDNFSKGYKNYYYFYSAGLGHMSISGNIMSLLDQNMEIESLKEHVFYQLFKGFMTLTDASNLKLPATTLAEYCYHGMFMGCTNLQTAPELPATNLARACYGGMFSGCTSLVAAPELPATTLAIGCYYGMFSDCSSLQTAPELPATNLADRCYSDMFMGCTNLQTAPELPATNLTEYCYSGMFSDCSSLQTAPELLATTLAISCYYNMFVSCSSLQTAPELPATNLAPGCYTRMFYGCKSLQDAPELPATTLAEYCYSTMFYGCTNLQTAPELPATNLAPGCYSEMFSGCSKLNYVKAMFIILPSETYTMYWLDGVSSTGTFIKSKNATWNVIGSNGIPEGWQIKNCEEEPEYVDLGLSVKWATCNIGATKPEEYGNYYAWGEVETKEAYYYPDGGRADNSSWVYYKWARNRSRGDGTYFFEGLTKYTTSSVRTYLDAYDNKIQLDSEDDVAIKILGDGWRMPTATELDELHSQCTWKWTTTNGVKGYEVSRNGKSIFLPCTGCCAASNIPTGINSGSYWSSSLNSNYADCAWGLDFQEDYVVSPKDGYCNVRYYGYTIRPVHD